MKEEIIHNIEELFKKWYYIHMLDSTSTWGKNERKELVDYCKEHIKEFKEFAQDTLEHPYDWCIDVTTLCDELLPDEKPIDEQTTFAEKFVKICKRANLSFYAREIMLFDNCNIWLNYFKGTEDINYYGDYVRYKEYLDKHYIGWKPNEENDPNPTYEEYLKNKEKYKI